MITKSEEPVSGGQRLNVNQLVSYVLFFLVRVFEPCSAQVLLFIPITFSREDVKYSPGVFCRQYDTEGGRDVHYTTLYD